MNGNLEELLAPPLAGVLFGTMAHVGFENGKWTMAATFGGYVIGQVAEYFKKHPIRVGGVFASETKGIHQPDTTFFLEKEDFTARIKSDISFSKWQRVGEIIVAWNARNLNLSVIEEAFPHMAQREQRKIRLKMVGLLEPEHVGVLIVKNNAAEITYPVGRNFFARVSRGMVAPLYSAGILSTPPDKETAKNTFSKEHARAPHGILNLGKAV